MSVWFAIPSARPLDVVAKCVDTWHAQGYQVALLRQGELVPSADLQTPTNIYFGWAQSTNLLAREILRTDPQASWIVGGGDDYLPDLNHTAEEIARQCGEHFLFRHNYRYVEEWKRNGCFGSSICSRALETFGIMQPTGDRWGADEKWAQERYPNAPAYIDRICGSPWMGREWCRRMYGGRGPMWGGYKHMFADEELQNVAIQMGLLWQRQDLIQFHDHWMRHGKTVPDFLQHVNTQDHWNTSREMFHSRKSSGFPNHEPIP